MTEHLTKEETAALWHAVQAYADLVKAMPSVAGVNESQVDVEKKRLRLARRALRKVNELRKQGQ